MNLNYLELLPDEMLLKLLSETDDLKTLSKWCQTSKRVNRICRDEGFWHNKYRKDFGIGLTLVEGETWREQYKQITLNINSPISVGSFHYGIIDRKGILYMAGQNNFGQLGNGTTIYSTKPMVLQFKQKIIGISCAGFYTAALTADGKIYVWGNLDHLDGIDEFVAGIERNKYGQRKQIRAPLLFNFPHPAIKILSGSRTLGIIAADHTVYFTGYTKPINIKAIDIASSRDKYAIIGTDRKLYIWGSYHDFDDNIKQKTINQPKHVPLPELVKQISFARDHYAVLSIRGNVYIWGSNKYGELGFPSGHLKVPTKLDLPSPISFISMMLNTSAALTKDGKLYMWGMNNDGMILNEDHAPNWVNLKPTQYPGINYVPRPIQISIEEKIINYVEVGAVYTLALTNDDVVNYWGDPELAPE